MDQISPERPCRGYVEGRGSPGVLEGLRRSLWTPCRGSTVALEAPGAFAGTTGALEELRRSLWTACRGSAGILEAPGASAEVGGTPGTLLELRQRQLETSGGGGGYGEARREGRREAAT